MSSRVRTALHRARPALPDRSAWCYGLVAGACAFVVGFAVTYFLEGRRVRNPTRPLVELYFYGGDAGVELNVGPTGPLPDVHQFAAWQYLSLHGAGFERRGGVGWTLAPPTTQLLVFVPAVLLLAAGAIVVRRHGTDDPWTAAKRGGTVVLGYLPLVVLAALASQWAAPESVVFEYFGVEGYRAQPVGTIGLSPLGVAPIAGIIYPVAFGTVGGYLAFAWSRETWPSRDVNRGVVAGAIAFLVGWRVAVIRSFDRERRVESWRTTLIQGGPDGTTAGAFDPDTFHVGTWQFHRLHGGNVEVRYLGYVSDGFDVVRLPMLTPILHGFDPVSALVPVLLTVAGAAVAHRAETRDSRGAAVRGASIVLGYLPLSVATVALSSTETTGSIRAVVGVKLVDAFLLTGLAFPVAFGAVGGIVAHWITTGTDLAIDATRRRRQ